ncbi:MAG: HEAT repeat domain-containing protein [Bradymonadales bacterium]|nr:HEAT repeat domain-containing protein [Bradymonadales bacterium]
MSLNKYAANVLLITLTLMGSTAHGQDQPAEPALEYQPAPTATQPLPEVAPPVASIDDLDPNVLDRITTLLSGYHYFPTADDLLQVTDDPARYLLAIVYNSPDLWPPSQQHRAMDALAYFPSELTHAHMTYLLQSGQTPELLRHHVLTTLARGFGQQALDEIQPFLTSADVQLRLTAVSALSIIPEARSTEILRTALGLEESQLVRERIEEVIETRTGDQPPLTY